MPASSILTWSFDDCETDGLSSNSCTIFFYYTTIRKCSILITNVSQKCFICLLILLLVTKIFFLSTINVCHTRALSLFSTALLLLVAASGNSAAVLLRELDSAAAGLLRELEVGADS